MQLARALGLPGNTYAHDYYFPDDLAPREYSRERTKELAEFALEAIKTGELRGRQALHFVGSSLFHLTPPGNSVEPEDVLYHGSPYELATAVQLQPMQATWQDLKARRYADGQKAICASRQPDFPSMRALLHEAQPALQGIKWNLSKRRDLYGRTHWFTSEEALEAIQGSKGYVYPINQRGQNGLDTARYDAGREEYRIFEPRTWLARVAVNATDLPPKLLVIGTDNYDALLALPTYRNPREWSDGTGVAARTLNNLWPMEYFPF